MFLCIFPCTSRKVFFAVAGTITLPVKVEGMVGDMEFEQFAHHVFYLLDTWVAKFQYAATVHADQMVVLFIAVGFFVLCQVFAKLVFFDQVAIDQ